MRWRDKRPLDRAVLRKEIVPKMSAVAQRIQEMCKTAPPSWPYPRPLYCALLECWSGRIPDRPRREQQSDKYSTSPEPRCFPADVRESGPLQGLCLRTSHEASSARMHEARCTAA